MLFPYNAANAGIGVAPDVFGYGDEVSLIHGFSLSASAFRRNTNGTWRRDMATL